MVGAMRSEGEGDRHNRHSKGNNGMSNTERKKDIDNVVDLLERAKAMAEEMKSADDDTFNEMNDARQAEHENDAEVEASEEMQNLEASMEVLEEAIDAMDDAIGAMLRA